MSDADPPNGSPPDPSGGSSSAPIETSDVEIACDKSVRVIKRALVYDSKGKGIDLPADSVKPVAEMWCRTTMGKVPTKGRYVTASNLHHPDRRTTSDTSTSALSTTTSTETRWSLRAKGPITATSARTS